jgi:hypothetical protein
MNPHKDPIIDEIRKVRHQISEAHDHDPKKVIDYYIELQKKYGKKHIKE